jgi:hypothetical protein
MMREELKKVERPIEAAQMLYAHNGRDADEFARDVWDHLLNGFIHSTPRHFAMVRAVVLDDGRQAWLVNSAVGPLKEIIRLLPFPLPYIAFYRGLAQPPDKLRVYDFQKFVARIEKSP